MVKNILVNSVWILPNPHPTYTTLKMRTPCSYHMNAPTKNPCSSSRKISAKRKPKSYYNCFPTTSCTLSTILIFKLISYSISSICCLNSGIMPKKFLKSSSSFSYKCLEEDNDKNRSSHPPNSVYLGGLDHSMRPKSNAHHGHIEWLNFRIFGP